MSVLLLLWAIRGQARPIAGCLVFIYRLLDSACGAAACDLLPTQPAVMHRLIVMTMGIPLQTLGQVWLHLGVRTKSCDASCKRYS